MTARALWYIGDGKIALRDAALMSDASLTPVRALYSGLSRGTERLVLEGRVPASEHQRMRCPHQEGSFPFPVKYGYALVGTVTSGPRRGETVFALHPHQTEVALPAEWLHAVPTDVPPRRAVLAANAETALNAIWDSGVSAGDRVLVIGAGVLGLLIAALAVRIPGAEVTVIDRDPARAKVARHLGAHFAEAVPAGSQDVVFNASASGDGLAAALAAAGDEATIVEASWYGATQVSVPLGADFHARRLRIVSSQVGQLPPARRPRWNHARRLQTALALLRDPAFDELVTGEIAFADAADVVPTTLRATAGLMTVLRY